MKKEDNHPLVLVFYIDRDTMTRAELIKPFVESVNFMIEAKGANVLAFFLPTDGEERIACLNPNILSDLEMVDVTKLIDDIKQNFSIGSEINVPETEITPDTKDCTCNGGECNCVDKC